MNDDPRIEAAWQNFVVDMQHHYPAAEWPAERLRLARTSLLKEAEFESQMGDGAERVGEAAEASEHYNEAAELRREANGIAALLIDKGDLVMEGDAQTTLEFMERAIQGETEAPRWLITTHDPETGGKDRGCVKQPEEDALADALWEQVTEYVGVQERYLTVGLLKQDPENVMAYPLPTYPTCALLERSIKAIEEWESELRNEEGPLTPEQEELWLDLPERLKEYERLLGGMYPGRYVDESNAFWAEAEAAERYSAIMKLQEGVREPGAPYIVEEPVNLYEQHALSDLTRTPGGDVYFKTVSHEEFARHEARWNEWAGAKQMLTAQYAIERDIGSRTCPNCRANMSISS